MLALLTYYSQVNTRSSSERPLPRKIPECSADQGNNYQYLKEKKEKKKTKPNQKDCPQPIM